MSVLSRPQFLTVLLLLLGLSSVASETSTAQGYRGKDFFVSFPLNSRQEGAKVLEQWIYIASESRAHGQIENLFDGKVTLFSVEAGASTAFIMPDTLQFVTSGLPQMKSLHVSSDNDISVFVVSHRSASTDSYQAIPTPLLGTSYLVVGYHTLPTAGFATQFSVTATEDNTLVTMRIAGRTADSVGTGRTLMYPLRKGETVQIKADPRWPNSDLSGTAITSNRPISVVTGHSCAQVPVDVSYCDLLMEMLPPLTDAGKEFVLARFAGKSHYTIRAVALEDSTEILLNGSHAAWVNARGYYEHNFLDRDVVLTSSRPVVVVQYATSSESDSVRIGDPFMVNVAPTNRYVTDVTSTSVVQGQWRHFLNIVVPTRSLGSLELDGLKQVVSNDMNAEASLHNPVDRPFASAINTPIRYTQLQGSPYTVLTYMVGTGHHVVKCDEGIAVYSYGFGLGTDNFDSYGHLCGMKLDSPATSSR